MYRSVFAGVIGNSDGGVPSVWTSTLTNEVAAALSYAPVCDTPLYRSEPRSINHVTDCQYPDVRDAEQI